jgi:dienelactone hydrolase
MSEASSCPWPMEFLAALPPPQLANTIELRQGDRTLALSECYFPSTTYLGRPTRVFGYYARPANVPEPLPAILLIHGGGGTADPYWARYWAQRGYPALALDLYGQGPNQAKLEGGGPDWSDNFASFRLTHGLENTWIYQSIAACIAGITALTHLPEVDPNRIAVTGISWGGYFCCTVMSIDDRIRLGIPMYGCGYNKPTASGPGMEEDGRIQRERFDPSNFFPMCHKPVLWVTAVNDRATPLDELEQSYRAVPGPKTLCVALTSGHSDIAAVINGARLELEIFADSIFRGTDALATLGAPTIEGRELRVSYAGPIPPSFALLNWTTDHEKEWPQRRWQNIRAEWSPELIRATLPPEHCTAYLAVVDARGALVSSEFVHVGS